MLIRAAIVLALVAGCRHSKPIGGCTYRMVQGTCDLRGVDTEPYTEGKVQLNATYAWHGPLPAANLMAERKLDWIVTTIEAESFRAKLAAKPSVGCQYQIEGGPCPPTLVLLESELPTP